MNKTRFALLGLLAERAYSGYELKQVVAQRFALFWKESYGQIYPELKRLAAEGLVTSRTEGARAKTTYALTEPGLTALSQWLGDPADEDQIRSERLLKLYFSAFAGDEVRRRHLEAVRDRAAGALLWLSEAEAQLTALIGADKTHPRALAIIRLGLADQRARRDWASAELRSTRY